MTSVALSLCCISHPARKHCSLTFRLPPTLKNRGFSPFRSSSLSSRFLTSYARNPKSRCSTSLSRLHRRALLYPHRGTLNGTDARTATSTLIRRRANGPSSALNPPTGHRAAPTERATEVAILHRPATAAEATISRRDMVNRGRGTSRRDTDSPHPQRRPVNTWDSGLAPWVLSVGRWLELSPCTRARSFVSGLPLIDVNCIEPSPCGPGAVQCPAICV